MDHDESLFSQTSLPALHLYFVPHHRRAVTSSANKLQPGTPFRRGITICHVHTLVSRCSANILSRSGADVLFRRRTTAQRPRDKTDGQLRERSKRAPRSPGLRKYVCLILPVMCPAANGGERRTKDLAGSRQRWRGVEEKGDDGGGKGAPAL